jgi:hypothetical protein
LHPVEIPNIPTETNATKYTIVFIFLQFRDEGIVKVVPKKGMLDFPGFTVERLFRVFSF